MNDLQRLLQSFEQHNAINWAIRSSTEQLHYADLQAKTTRFRKIWQELPQSSEHRLALLLPKSSAYVAALMAAMLEQLVYIPVDYAAPPARSAYILENASCNLILTTVERSTELQAKQSNIRLLQEVEGLQLLQITTSTPPLASPDDLAFILYTSGSTGRPKGVYTTATNAASFVKWAGHTFSVSSEDVIASVAPFHFDLSVFDLFAGLSAGATLVLFAEQEAKNPRLLAQMLAQEQVSTLYATPTLLQLLLHYGKLERYDFSRLRQVLFAGEVFPIPALRSLKAIWPHTEFYNLYGPTETNVVSWYPVPAVIPEDQTDPFPIGRLCPYAEARIIQEGHLQTLRPGMAGELSIAGQSLSPGYVDLPEVQAARFHEQDGKLWYTTGDVVRVDEEGQLVYQGRTDRMIKRRGFRIELAEIEQNIQSHPDLRVVGSVSIQQEQPCLLVFYEAAAAVSEVKLKQYLAERLPLYMMPDRFVWLEQLPLTASQKINYPRLEEIALNYV